MATPIERFAFDPPEGWGDATVFPTYEANETQVRADLQRLHDQTRDYLNDQLLQSVDDAIEGMEEYVQEAISGIVVGTLPDDSVTGDKLVEGAITDRELGAGSVSADKLSVTGGSNGNVLTKDSSATGGMKWANAMTDVFYAGTTAPSNTKLLWVDTTTTTGGLKYYNGSAWVYVPVAFA